MAWTRAGQVGPQLNTIVEWTATIATGAGIDPTVSSTKAHLAGQTYSARFATGQHHKSAGLTFSAASQVRAGVWLNHNGLGAASSTYLGGIFRWVSNADNTNFLRWKGDTGALELVLSNTLIDSLSIGSAGLSTVDTWYHVGIIVEASTTVGRVSVYVDGIEVLAVSGQNTGSNITDMYFGGNFNNGWANYAYFSDFYVDTGSGNAHEAPPKKAFLWGLADGNGYSSQWTGSDADSTDNYLLVDDTTPDDDTTHVKAESVDLVDAYTTANITVPAGYSIVARIPTVLGKRAGTTEQLILGNYDGSVEELGSGKVPTSAYAPVWDRFEAQPDTTDWNETDFNAMQTVIKSAGTF